MRGKCLRVFHKLFTVIMAGAFSCLIGAVVAWAGPEEKKEKEARLSVAYP